MPRVPAPSFRLTRREAARKLGLFLAGSPLLRGQLVSREGHARVPSLEEMANVFEFEPVARGNMTRRSYDYVAGGVEDEVTLRRNREAFNWISLIPNHLRGVAEVNLSTTILGHSMHAPILVAPTGGQAGVHPQGDVEMHRGASAARATMCSSFVATFPLSEIAASGDGPLWPQLYVHLNPTRVRERVDQAAAVGAQALVWTVDAQYSSLRERLRHDAALGQRTTERETQARSRRRRGRRTPPANPYRLNPESPSEDWMFLETLRSWTDLPILVKGLLTWEDARLAVESGADGIVVSNHGARYMPHCASTIETLPEIVAEVKGRIPVLIDGGFRRGGDVLKALALGASGVLVGRPPLWGLGAFGAAGAERVLRILQAELAHAMSACGVSRIPEITPDLVQADWP